MDRWMEGGGGEQCLQQVLSTFKGNQSPIISSKWRLTAGGTCLTVSEHSVLEVDVLDEGKELQVHVSNFT